MKIKINIQIANKKLNKKNNLSFRFSPKPNPIKNIEDEKRMRDILSPVIKTEKNPAGNKIKDEIKIFFLFIILKIIKPVKAIKKYFVINIPTTGLFLKGPVSLVSEYLS